MDEQSLQDLLALIESRNITQAAQRRNVSQPAYSRRLQAIEAIHGTTLVDRSQRPARPTPALDAMRDEMELVLASLRRLHNNLSHSSAAGDTITIAAVHTLASGPIPTALSRIGFNKPQRRIRLKSANNDVCFQMLMTEEVSLMLAYETPTQFVQAPRDLVEKIKVATDYLVPVCRPELVSHLMNIVPGRERIPLIAYPGDGFLGRVLFDEALIHSPHLFSETLIAGLTSAVMAGVREGLAVAWLPLTLIREAVNNKELVILDSPYFPRAKLDVSMLRLRTKSMQKMRPWLSSLAEAVAQTISQSCDGFPGANNQAIKPR